MQKVINSHSGHFTHNKFPKYSNSFESTEIWA